MVSVSMCSNAFSESTKPAQPIPLRGLHGFPEAGSSTLPLGSSVNLAKIQAFTWAREFWAAFGNFLPVRLVELHRVLCAVGHALHGRQKPPSVGFHRFLLPRCTSSFTMGVYFADVVDCCRTSSSTRICRCCRISSSRSRI